MKNNFLASVQYKVKDLFGFNHRFSFRRSYSQFGEDLIVLEFFRQKKIYSFTYLDIGCNHPYRFNNTALFYTLGMTGYCVDANPKLSKEFKKSRPKDQVFSKGIGPFLGSLDFYLMKNSTLSTFSRSEFEEYLRLGYELSQVVPIEVITLTDFIKIHCCGLFPDFLSIDVEGLDFEILTSYDWSSTIPRVVCVETRPFNKSTLNHFHSLIHDFLLDKGYELYSFTSLNSIFVLEKELIL